MLIFFLSLINFLFSLIILILNPLLCIKNYKIRKEIIKYKYFYQDIEELGIFVFIIPISFVLTLIFLSFCIYLFFTNFNTTTLKFSIPDFRNEFLNILRYLRCDDRKKRLIKELIQKNNRKEYLRDLSDKIKNENLKKNKENDEMDTNYSEIEKSVIYLQEERDKLLNDITELEKQINEKKQEYQNEIKKLEIINNNLQNEINYMKQYRDRIKDEYKKWNNKSLDIEII